MSITDTMIKCTRPNCVIQVNSANFEASLHNSFDGVKRPFCCNKCARLTRNMEEKRSKAILTDENKKFLKIKGFQKYKYSSDNGYSFNGNAFYSNEAEYPSLAHFNVAYYAVVDLLPKRIERKFEIAEHTTAAIQNAFNKSVEFIMTIPSFEIVAADAKAQRAPKELELQALNTLEKITCTFLAEAERLLEVNLSAVVVVPFALIKTLSANMKNWKKVMLSIERRRNNEDNGQPQDSPVLECVDESQHTPAYFFAMQLDVNYREYLENGRLTLAK